MGDDDGDVEVAFAACGALLAVLSNPMAAIAGMLGVARTCAGAETLAACGAPLAV